MKVRTKLASVLLALCLMAALLPSAAFAADNTPTLLALGDGIAKGHEVSEADRFTHQVAEYYNLTEVNKAFGTATAADIHASLSNGELDAELSRAGMIVLTCGGMDMAELLFERTAQTYNSSNKTKLTGEDVANIIRGSYEGKITTGDTAFRTALIRAVNGFADTSVFKNGLVAYEKDLVAIFTYIREKNPTAQVVMPTQLNPFQKFKSNLVLKPVYTNVNEAVTAINKVIKNHASELNYVVADIYPTFTNTSEHLLLGTASGMNFSFSDFFPNAKGHSKIAKIINDKKLTITPPPMPEEPLPFEPGVPAIHVSEKNVSLTDGTVKVNLNAMDGKMSVSAAFYNGDKMVGVDYVVPAADMDQVTLSANLRGTATSVRVFLMDGTHAPILDAPIAFPAA